MNITKNALKVLETRYLARDENGQLVEDPLGMFKRVAQAVAQADKDYVSAQELIEIENKFFTIMSNLEFLPNSPTLMNAGRPLGQLSACFVLPVEDSMEGIFESIKNSALIHKSGGGTGFSFSRLRPKGATVKSTGGEASGPISFIKVFNAATEAVKQGGKRRGANMAILRVDHPDILEFISCKQDNQEITNFNISVGLTESFMTAVEADKLYPLIDPHNGQVTGQLKAKDVFEKIVEMAWKNGEPGIIFLDRLNQANVTPELGEIESTNPCGEQPLLANEACNLGSINLSLMVKETQDGLTINYDKLGQVVDDAVHFLDNVIDVNAYPLPQIAEMTRGTRKIGLGVMGWADLLCKLRLAYNSEAAILLAKKVMDFIQTRSRQASTALATKKGVFPFYNKSIYAQQGLRVRNATTTTIAPTGTISLIAGVSSGIEPLFAISYIRNVMDQVELIEVNPIFKKYAKEQGLYNEQLMKRIAEKGSIRGVKEIPASMQEIFITSHDIAPEWHVRMQAAFQEFTDNAVSKTVNLRHEATLADVRDVYVNAYQLGCKGVTLYRDGSRELQVLNIGEVKGRINETVSNTHIAPRQRPAITTGFTEKVKTGCGNLYITVNYDEKGICEVFTNTGRAGGCPSQSEATSRLVSIALRSGMDVKHLVEQLKGIRCASTIRQKGLKVLSCPDAIGRLIEKVAKLQNGEKGALHPKKSTNNTLKNTGAQLSQAPFYEQHAHTSIACCPDCGEQLEHEGGCVICRYCGYSKCG